MSSLRVFVLCFILLIGIAAAGVFDGEDSAADDALQFDKRNFQYIWRNLPIAPPTRQLSDKRSDGLSRDRASAFYRLG